MLHAGAGVRALPARALSAWPILLAMALSTAALWPSPQSLIHYWHDIADYRHGYLIAVVCVAWISRDLWTAVLRAGAPDWRGTLLIIPALFAWLLAQRAGLGIAHQMLWPIVLWLAVAAMAGYGAARRMLPAIVLFYFAIPVWDYGLPLLQRMSIAVSEFLLGVLGIPAQVTDYRVTIPEGAFEIVEGCSGKRYLVVALAVAWLGVAVNNLRGSRAVQLLALAALLALVMNWVRIVIVIYAGHATQMRHYLVANEHQSLGNVMFAVLIVVVVLLGRRLALHPNSDLHGVDADVPRPATGGGVGRLWPALLLVAVPAMEHAGPREGSTPAQFGPLPVGIGRWQGPLPPRAGWVPHYVKPDDDRRVAYAGAGGIVELYANLYGRQFEGRELIQFGNQLVAPETWSALWQQPGDPLEAGGRRWTVLRMRGPDDRIWLLARAYFVGERLYSSELGAKLAYGWYSLAGPAPAGILAAASVCEQGNCDNARTLVADFWENMQLPMRALLPDGADPRHEPP